MPMPIKPFLLSAITSLCLMSSGAIATEAPATPAAAQKSVPLHRVSQGPAPRITDGIGVYDASVDLFDDGDGDGYYSRIAVGFDADALNGGYVDVFAEISAVDVYGMRWPLITTSVFRINGDWRSDARYVELSLGDLPPRSYTLRVDLYDACCSLRLDTLETPAGQPLRLESTYHDSYATCCTDDHHDGTYVTEEVHGGALGGTLLLAALSLGVRRRRQTIKG
jgi:hypothetical protein